MFEMAMLLAQVEGTVGIGIGIGLAILGAGLEEPPAHQGVPLVVCG